MTRKSKNRWLIAPFTAALAALPSCMGDLGSLPTDGEVTEAPSSLCKAHEPGHSPIRRMTRREYNNTVAELLGDATHPANSFAPEEEALGFNNQASALVVSPLLAEQYMNAAESLAAAVVPELLKQMPSCASDASSAACQSELEKVLADLGKRAFRRPLAAEEIAGHVALYQQGITLGATPNDSETGLSLVVQAILQEPDFLYRVELGQKTPVENDIVELTSWEMATRLSYFFWGTMPDAELFQKAEADALRTPEAIEAEARRMLADPKARETVREFHRQWLGLGKIDDLAASGKDPVLFPDFDNSLLPLMRQETENFLDHAIFEENASVSTLFTAPWTMMNKKLADFYGISGPTGEAFERVDLDPTKYAGIMTQAGLLALYAKPNRSSPVHRGKFVRQALLCQTPPPPPDAVPPAPEVDPTKTTREQFQEHTASEVCRNCHRLLDPIGFGFENYDAVGRFRAMENGLPVDASGEIVETRDANGTFVGATELAAKLGQSEQVRECVTKQWFRYANGRAEQKEDDCSMSQLADAFEQSGNDVKELLVAMTLTDAFRYRHIPVPGGEY